MAHLLPRRYPVSLPEEMSKALPSPVYVAPTEGMEELPEVSEDIYEDELIIPKSNYGFFVFLLFIYLHH